MVFCNRRVTTASGPGRAFAWGLSRGCSSGVAGGGRAAGVGCGPGAGAGGAPSPTARKSWVIPTPTPSFLAATSLSPTRRPGVYPENVFRN